MSNLAKLGSSHQELLKLIEASKGANDQLASCISNLGKPTPAMIATPKDKEGYRLLSYADVSNVKVRLELYSDIRHLKFVTEDANYSVDGEHLESPSKKGVQRGKSAMVAEIFSDIRFEIYGFKYDSTNRVIDHKTTGGFLANPIAPHRVPVEKGFAPEWIDVHDGYFLGGAGTRISIWYKTRFD